MKNNFTPETNFEKILLSDIFVKQLLERIEKNFCFNESSRYIFENGVLDDHFTKQLATDICSQLFILNKVVPLKKKLEQYDPLLEIDVNTLIEIQHNGRFADFELQLDSLISGRTNEDGELKIEANEMNKYIKALTDRILLSLNLKEKEQNKPNTVKV